MTEAETTPTGENVAPATGITKLFIGSLSFKTGKPSLTKAFTDLEVEVKTAKVVRNNNGCSMGYGFVEIADKDVENAVEKLHHTELDGRQINVEKATSTKPKRKTRRVTRQPNTNNKKSESTEANSSPKEKSTRPAPVKRDNTNRPKPKPRQPRASPVPRESSETKLYVANIPFSLTDSELAEHFSDLGKVEAKVIVNKKTLRSRGYGFVEVENLEIQKKAIADKNKSEIGGRAITVRAAYRELPTPDPSTETAETTEAVQAKTPIKKAKKPRKKTGPKKDTVEEGAAEPKIEEALNDDKPVETQETPSA